MVLGNQRKLGDSFVLRLSKLVLKKYVHITQKQSKSRVWLHFQDPNFYIHWAMGRNAFKWPGLFSWVSHSTEFHPVTLPLRPITWAWWKLFCLFVFWQSIVLRMECSFILQTSRNEESLSSHGSPCQEVLSVWGFYYCLICFLNHQSFILLFVVNPEFPQKVF